MNLLPNAHEEFSHKEYWDSFFKKRGTKAFEWYGEYPELCGLLHKYIKTHDVILMIGCGNSTLSADMYDVGYRNIVNIDISQVAVKQMQESHGRDRPSMTYETMDATNTTFKDAQFSAVLDKGTLDALMPDTSEECQARIEKLFNEIDRVLRVGGRYVCISLLQQHILSKLLSHFSTAGWIVRVCRCLDAERKAAEDSGDRFGFPVFGVVCTKVKKMENMSPVLEVFLDGVNLLRLSSCEEVIENIQSVQQSAMVCSRLSRGSLATHGEVSLDLCRPGDSVPRYTVHVLDQPYGKHTSRQFAAFIVPQGRETEWLFSSADGRATLLRSAGFDRLAVVCLHRDQDFTTLDSVQSELSESVRSLAPCGLSPEANIPYLSVGDDVGKREICHRGHSPLSGPYVVEEVAVEGGCLSRRLVFLNNQMVVQSEARLKLLKSRKGPRKVVDYGFLACEHHTYMVAGVALSAPDVGLCEVLVVGLGGGGLCTFLQHCFNKIKVTAVDIDPSMLEVATNYFDLVQNERLVVYIRDGLQFISQAAEKGSTFHTVLLDVDSKDQSLGMSCPPPEFLEPTLLNAVKQLLNKQGLLLVNLVCRKTEVRDATVKKLKDVFPNICSYKLEQDVNEVIICSERHLDKEIIKMAAEKANTIAKKRKLQTANLIDVVNLISSLKVGE